MRRWSSLSLFLLIVALCRPSHADEPARAAPIAPAPNPSAYSFGPNEICPFCQLTPQFPEGRSGLHWHDHWRAVGLQEYIVAPSLLAATLAMTLALPQPSSPKWTSPILFDESMRDTLRLSSPSGRRNAAKASDYLFYWEVLHPTVIDPLIAAWWVRKSPRVAWQMFMINAQAYALTLFVNDVTKRLTRRERPWVQADGCEQTPDEPRCQNPGRYRSFFSGHAATTATGAGLLCAHHTQLSLYGDPWLDGGTCLLAVAGTAVTGALRISSDNHWASDVIVGHLVGYLSGYLLPTLMYYREFRATPHDHPEGDTAPVMAALPMITPSALGLSVFGLF